MSTPDRLLYVALHGTAMRYAVERRNLDESIEELRDIADGRNDVLAQAAGITAGSWYAWPSRARFDSSVAYMVSESPVTAIASLESRPTRREPR
jgi:hypothetical protein